MSKRFRSGDINAAGGRSLQPQTQTYRCVTQGMIHSVANTAQVGGHFVVIPGSYNTPVRMNAVLNFVDANGTGPSRHPTGHQHVIADGYTTFMVKSCFYDLDFRWTGTQADDIRYGIAYKFDTVEDASAPTWPAANASVIENILDMKQTKAWVFFDLPTIGTNSGERNHTKIRINIPDVPGLTIRLQKNTAVTQFTTDDLIGVINDSAGKPAVNTFLHIMAWKMDVLGSPAAWATGDIWIDIRCSQTVQIWRPTTASNFIEAGDDV